MSRGFIKEGDQEEIPMVPPRAYLPKGMPNYVTKEGLDALDAELKNLENERAMTGENYIMSNFIDAKMKLLINRINSAVEVDVSKANKDTVSFGAYVRYNGRVIRIVGVDEADVSKGLVSFISPIAKALVGKKVGDMFELKVPKGTEKITVEEISYEPMPLTETASSSNNSPAVTSSILKDVKSNSQKESATTIKIEEDKHVEDSKETDKEEKDSKQKSVFTPEENIMEFLPVVNERGNIVGRALHMELHKGNKILHPVVHLHVINNKGVTARRYWWHVTFGDTPEKTLKKKISETLGLATTRPKLKKQYIRETKTEKELVFVYTMTSDENLLITPEGKEYFDIFAKD